MSTATQNTPTNVTVRVVVAALLLGLVYAWWPENLSFPLQSHEDDDDVSLVLVVERTTGGPPVDVSYTINSGPGYAGVFTGLRWSTEIKVRRSDSVTLRGYQGELGRRWGRGDLLKCSVRDRAVGVVDANQRQDAGSVRCYYNRR